MKLPLLAAFTLGTAVGGLGLAFLSHATAYFLSARAMGQGRDLIELIHEYEQEHGNAPSQEWFASLGEQKISCEDREWIYLESPLDLGENWHGFDDDWGDLRLLLAVNYSNSYLGVYENGRYKFLPRKKR